MNKDPRNLKEIASTGAAICSIFVLIGAIFGMWGLIVPVALYFLSVSQN